MRKKLLIFFVILTACSTIFGQSKKEEKIEREILNLMNQLAESALKSDSSAAEAIFDNALVLTSQSGKVYTKKDALQDFKNSFEIYRNDDIKFLHLDKNTVVVNYQNTRKRKSLDEAKFRVTAVWAKRKTGWKIVSMQSSKIVQQSM